MSSEVKRKIAYFYNNNIGLYYYGDHHPMKPIRIKMAHQLIVNYGLYRKMDIYEPHIASIDELTQFHTKDYIDYIESISRTDNNSSFPKKFNIGETDCPMFEGLINFSQISTGGSIDGARLLNNNDADIAINWAGGLHHARKMEASGFCYVNDIVIGILELLKYHSRVLYIDIDIHHGDGVEEAFYCSNRVMTLSFHRFGDFFPGTGSITDIGEEEGKYYSMNVPLKKGIDDESYKYLFDNITKSVIDYYRPSAIVLQSGADSLCYDKLGDFNLTLKGHGNCLDFLKKFNLPILLLGGGGYTVENVSRCWAYETSLALGETLSNDLPITDFYSKYGDSSLPKSEYYKLHFNSISNMVNLNDKGFLNELIQYSNENLKSMDIAPNVDYNLPDEMYSCFNNEVKSSKVSRKEHQSEFFDEKN